MGTFLTDSGFVKPTWQEFLLRTRQRFSAIWGPEFDAGDTTPAGQLAGIIAKSLADSADADQEIYASLDPLQATGEALRRIAALRGTWAQSASASRVRVTCYCETADEGLSISPTDKVRRVRGGVIFSAVSSTAISRSSASDVYFGVPDDLPAGTTISVTFSFGTFSVTVDSSGTLYALQVLAGHISQSWGVGFAEAYVAAPGPGYAYGDRALRVATANGTFQFISSSNISLSVLGSPVWFACDATGPVDALPGEISVIETPESGWLSCLNLSAAIRGRNDETDEELRVRMYLRDGKATEDAIRKKILNDVVGVSACSVRSNRTLGFDADGRPPKSFEVTVEGGEDQDIADAIWSTAPAGIEIFADPAQGGVVMTSLDSEGRAQTVKFSRPIAKVLHAKIVLTRYYEESIPDGGIAAIRSAILAWSAKEFTAGQDVIPRRFNVPIYSVPGIADTTIYVAVTSLITDTPVFTQNIIQVGSRVHVVLSEDTLSVELVS